jgi:probable rRNA maturation factor
LSLVVADDETVRDLNRRYRGLDEVTDVLSFSPHHGGPYEGEAKPPGEKLVPFPQAGLQQEFLGEVILAYPQAERQAAQAGHPVPWEVANLVVHGILHLLGQDHGDPQSERTMLEQQRAALDRLFPGSKDGG